MTTHDNAPPPDDWALRHPLKRKLEDGCDGCGYSTVYCDSFRDVSGERCCKDCSHGRP